MAGKKEKNIINKIIKNLLSDMQQIIGTIRLFPLCQQERPFRFFSDERQRDPKFLAVSDNEREKKRTGTVRTAIAHFTLRLRKKERKLSYYKDREYRLSL